MMLLAQPDLHTERLTLSVGLPSLGPAVAAYHRRNRAHLAPWDPPTPESFFSDAAQTARLEQGLQALAAGQACRWWLTRSGQADEIIGMVHFSQISRGAFCSCVLGYALDAQCQSQGLMREALQAALAEMFSPRVNLHRVQAAVRPENGRSLNLLRRLGFAEEGLARDYLFIDGAWRDHRLLAVINPAFTPPGDW